jgi:hypothetical protein
VILVVIAFLAYLVRPAQERAIQAIGRAGL